MTSETRSITVRDGTGQRNRMLKALEPQYVSVEERADEDLLRFIHAYVKKLRFFNEKNEPTGNWLPLLNVSGGAVTDPDEEIRLITRYINDTDFVGENHILAQNLGKPHLVLLLAFLHLLRHPRQQFRDITRRHLEYYFRDVLKLKERTAVPDSLYIVFELAKDYDSCHISKGALLDAGKDSQGIDVRYAINEDIVVNRAWLSSIKSVYAGKYRGHVHTIHATSIADEKKGVLTIPSGTKPFVNIQDRSPLNIGFAVTSPVLSLREGERMIVVTLTTRDESQLPPEFVGISSEFACPFEVSISTVKEWLKIDRPRMIAGNFIKGNSDDTYEEKELPFTAETGTSVSIQFIINRYDFDSNQIGQCIIDSDGAIYRITGITGERELQEMTLVKLGRVENLSEFRCCTLLRNALRFTLHLHDTAPVVTIPKPDGSFHDIHSSYPVIHFLLKNSTPDKSETISTSYYEQFSSFIPEKVIVEVDVKGIKDLLLRNEITLLDMKKPFEPFGGTPKSGTGLYIAHPELAAKHLDSFYLHIEWADLPADFAEYYQPYFQYGATPAPITNTSFNAQLKILLNQVWESVGVAKQLFGETLGKPVSLLYSGFDLKEYFPKPAAEIPAGRDPLEVPHCFKLELGEPDFQHDAYPKVINEAATTQAKKMAALTTIKLDQALKLMKSPLITKEIGGLLKQFFGVIKVIMKEIDALLKVIQKEEKATEKKIEDAKKQLDKLAKETGVTIEKKKEPGEEMETPVTIPPPYVPVMKSISCDYTSSVEIDFSKEAMTEKPEEITGQLFQLLPFGFLDLSATSSLERCLLPRYDEEGYLYLGLAELKPPTDISLLYHPEAGKIVREMKPIDIMWSYLSQNRWLEFNTASILLDTTDSLLNTGIISFSVPEEADTGNTVMPAGLHWLRAVARENPGVVPDIITIETQTVMATFQDSGNAPDHLAKPLEALSVKSLVQKTPCIKSVKQPFESCNGRMKETGQSFTIHVAERLRHKQRALTGWDYERLVLEEFPSIQKTKCLNQAELRQLEPNQRPGTAGVVIIVVPDIKVGLPSSSKEPGVPLYLLKDITDYLKSYASPFVEPEVRNPRYRQLQYRMTIGLGQGYDPGYYVNKLNEEIREFLSPWAYSKSNEICFYTGRKDSALLRFIEIREYVDFVADLKIIEPFEMQQDANYQPDPDVILVATPEHIIDLVPSTGYREKDYTGIGYMIVGKDFDVNHPQRLTDSIGRMRLGKDFTIRKIQRKRKDDSNSGYEKEH